MSNGFGWSRARSIVIVSGLRRMSLVWDERGCPHFPHGSLTSLMFRTQFTWSNHVVEISPTLIVVKGHGAPIHGTGKMTARVVVISLETSPTHVQIDVALISVMVQRHRVRAFRTADVTALQVVVCGNLRR